MSTEPGRLPIMMQIMDAVRKDPRLSASAIIKEMQSELQVYIKHRKEQVRHRVWGAKDMWITKEVNAALKELEELEKALFGID